MATLPRFFKIKTLRSLVTGHIPTSSAPPDGQLGETDLNPTQSSHVCVLSLFFTGLALLLLLLLHPHLFAESRIRSTRAIRFISSSRNDPLRNHPSGDRKRARDFLPLDFPSRSSLQGVVRFSEAMEGGWSYEQKTLISELILGANLARQLRAQLSSASSAENREVLIQGILNSYEKALFILKLSGPIMCQTQPVPGTTAGATGVLESPLSVNGSPCSNDFIDSRDISKKRKMLPKWTDQVKTSPETGLEGPHDDGYGWRKYGQKDILGAKYPRSYYRCTYRNTQNCWATKQVQRLDEDPTVFEITYRGKHTCALGGPSTPAPASPEKGEPKQINQGSSQQDQPQDPLTRFRTGLRVETENLDGSNISETPCTFSFPSSSSGFLHHEPYNTLGLASKGNHGGSLSSPFLSPSTPESNYFSVSQCPMNELGQTYNRDGCGSDLIDIISATNSCTNSPILDLDFSLDAVGIDPNFPFETAGYLP